MLQGFRGRYVGLGILLVTLSWGLFGCVTGLEVPTATTGKGGSERGISPQGVKLDEELVGSEREAALRQALEDWRVQAVKSLLESEGKQLELDRAQAFSFERGSHPGTLVLLPFGDELLFHLRFRDRIRIMLTAHRPGATLRAVNDAQERKDLLQEMQEKGAFQWLEEELKRRGRVLVPGLTLLLKDDSRQIVVFVVFTQPRKAHSSGLTAQLVFKLDPGVEGEAAGTIDLGDETTSSSLPRLDPGIGGGFALTGTTDVSVNTLTGVPFFEASHRTVSNEPTASVTVEGMLTSQQYQPAGSAQTACSNEGTGSTSCDTFFQASFCPSNTTIQAEGTGYHTGTYRGIVLTDSSQGSAQVNCP